MNRDKILLKAAYDFLLKLNQEREEVLAITVPYDGTECDGMCLFNDIANQLNLPDSDTAFVS